MGSQLEVIKDQEGNSHLIFDKSILYDDSKMGDKVQDFENLRILGTIKKKIKMLFMLLKLDPSLITKYIP